MSQGPAILGAKKLSAGWTSPAVALYQRYTSGSRRRGVSRARQRGAVLAARHLGYRSFRVSTQQILRVSPDDGAGWPRRRSSLNANACSDSAGQIRRRVFPATTQPRRTDTGVPATVILRRHRPGICRPRQSAGRPARAPPTRAGYPGPPGSPAAGSAEASGCALAHRARRAAHPAGQFACHGAPAPPRRDCHRRAPGASKWRNCAKLIGLYQCPPRGGQYQATSSQPSAGGGSRLVRVDPGNGSYPAGPGVGRRSLFPRHVAPHRYTRTGARYS